MSLVQCTDFWGGAEIFEAIPSLERHEGAYFMPFTGKDNWGIFDNSGWVLSATCNYRTEDKIPKHQNIIANINPDHIAELCEHKTMMYLGKFNPHYGHFIIDFLPRFWIFLQNRFLNMPILCHDSNAAEAWFQHPFVAEILGQLGLTPSHFVVYDRPIRLRNLIIPHSSFREQAFAHRAFALLGAKIGAPLAQKAKGSFSRKVYLSKARLTAGVQHIRDERVIEEKFSSAGFDIVYPELLPFADQVSLFSQDRTIVSTVNSSLHASIFAPAQSRIIGLSTIPTPNSNFALFDKLRQRKSDYFFAEGAVEVPTDPGFLSTYNLPDIGLIAEELIDIALRV